MARVAEQQATVRECTAASMSWALFKSLVYQTVVNPFQLREYLDAFRE
jgi:hypothetical protein